MTSVGADNSTSPADDLHCTHGQRRQMVTQLLIEDIFQGRLKAGTRLVIKDLAERYNVSPTPIREALVGLEGIGLAIVLPNRGAVIRKLSPTDAKEIAQVRKALECEATKLACGNIPVSQLNELANEFRRIMDSKRRPRNFNEKGRELDGRLHDLIAEYCGNRFLRQEIGRLKLLFRAIRDLAWGHRIYVDDPGRFLSEADEHLQIVLALIDGDAKLASKCMARHIREGLKYWSQAIPTA